jgi:hypothetical protein
MGKAPVASLIVGAALAACCSAQQNGATDGTPMNDAQLQTAVVEAREAALEAREAARAAQLALEQSKEMLTKRAETETPQTWRWRRAMSSSEHRRARLELQRWRRQSTARPTVYVNPLSYPRPISPGYFYTSITRTYSPYPPSTVVPVYRSRYQYSWYYE